MNINPFIFRAYDIRGIYGKDLNEEVFQKIGFILGKNKEKFLVGNDIRESGGKLAFALIQGLQSAGAKVVYSGTNSFGQCLFAGLASKTDKTLFITASHLPSDWNGLKMYFSDGEPFSQQIIEKLRDEIVAIWGKKIRFKVSKIKKVNFKREYIKSLFSKFFINKPLKVVVDCGDGSMSLVAPEIFKKFQLKTIEVFCKIDPSFKKRGADVTFEAIKVLREKVRKEKADFGVAFDGDGDRAIIIDDKGRYLIGDKIGVVLGKDILSNFRNKNKKIIKTVSCSMSIEEQLKPLGAQIIEIPVGHTFLISACKKQKAILGIEETGHMVMPNYFLFDDAVLIPLKIAEIIIKENKKLSEIVDQFKIYPFEELTFNCPDQKKFEVIEGLKKEFKKKYQKINFLDGVKVYFDFGWVLIRVSNTSPTIRLYVEAKTEKKFKLLKDKFSKILTEKLAP